MSIGGDGGSDELAASSAKQEKRADKSAKHVTRLSKKIERKGEKFFDTWIKDQLPDIKGLTQELQGRFKELDGQLGELGQQYADIGDSVQQHIDKNLDLADEYGGYRDQIAQIGAAVEGISAEQKIAYDESREKFLRDEEQYEQEGRPIFAEYAGKVREVANEQVGVEDKVSEAMGDVAAQESIHKQNMERQLASRGIQQNEASMRSSGAQFALAKAFAGTKAKTEAEATNRALAAQGVGMYQNLNQAGQQLDKSAQNQQLMAGIRQEGANLQAQQAGLTQMGAGMVGAEAQARAGVANLSALQADIYGKQQGVASLQMQGLGQRSALQSQQLADLSGAQQVMLNPYTAAMTGHTSVYQTSQQAQSSAMETNAKISSQEDQAASAGAGKLFGTVLGMFM